MPQVALKALLQLSTQVDLSSTFVTLTFLQALTHIVFLREQSFEETGQLYSESRDFPLVQVHLVAIVSGTQKLSSTLASASAQPALEHQDSCCSQRSCLVMVSYFEERMNEIVKRNVLRKTKG